MDKEIKYVIYCNINILVM